MNNENDRYWMCRALSLAKKGAHKGEVPIAAILVKENKILGSGFNQPIGKNDPTAHAEIVALRRAAKKMKNYRLPDTTLYVTLEPCAMCLGAMVQARVKRLVFAAYDLRAGAVKSVFRLLAGKKLNHHIIWEGGVLEGEARKLLQDFFRAKRKGATTFCNQQE